MVLDDLNGETINVGTVENPVPMDVTPDVMPDEPAKPSFMETVKADVKSVLTAPGKIVAANISEVGKGAGSTISSVTGPLIPVLILALIGGYIYFSSKRVNVNVSR